jgi:hypothetical protein
LLDFVEPNILLCGISQHSTKILLYVEYIPLEQAPKAHTIKNAMDSAVLEDPRSCLSSFALLNYMMADNPSIALDVMAL